jgi:serine/threonine-protein kinase RIO1
MFFLILDIVNIVKFFNNHGTKFNLSYPQFIIVALRRLLLCI